MTQIHGVFPSVFLRICKMLVVLAIATMTLLACDEPDTAINVAMDKKIPPTFSFSGPWWAVDFEVIELSKDEPSAPNNYSTSDKVIWKISLPKGQRAKAWPSITYGLVPKGFSQVIPGNDKPPELVEGKTYAAQAIDNSRSGGAIYFLIRNGELVNAPQAKLLKPPAN